MPGNCSQIYNSINIFIFLSSNKMAQQNPPNNNTSANTVLLNNLDISEPKLCLRLPKINSDGNGGAGKDSYNGNGPRPNGTFLPMPIRRQ